MKNYELKFPGIDYSFPMIFVEGTKGQPYLFGADEKYEVNVNDFFISQYPVTQRLWGYIMESDPSQFKGQERPVECVSFNNITGKNGFLDKLNSFSADELKLKTKISFRLPGETEWEYTARGGTQWRDDFQFSGSNDLSEVGWYELNSGKYSNPEILAKLKNNEKGTETHDVGQKLPNQLGVFDMCGNVWEWCQDYFQGDIHKIPNDGTPYQVETAARILRGGCHHNWDIHCTVSKRYEIIPEAKDECIGFRIAAAV